MPPRAIWDPPRVCENERAHPGQAQLLAGSHRHMPVLVMEGLRAWTDGCESQLGHSLAGGFVQSLSSHFAQSVPVPFPKGLTALTL